MWCSAWVSPFFQQMNPLLRIAASITAGWTLNFAYKVRRQLHFRPSLLLLLSTSTAWVCSESVFFLYVIINKTDTDNENECRHCRVPWPMRRHDAVNSEALHMINAIAFLCSCKLNWIVYMELAVNFRPDAQRRTIAAVHCLYRVYARPLTDHIDRSRRLRFRWGPLALSEHLAWFSKLAKIILNSFQWRRHNNNDSLQ